MDIRKAVHPHEEIYFMEMMNTVVFEDDAEKYYLEYTEKKRRPDLLGKTVRVTPLQFPQIYESAVSISERLEIEVPDIFVYEDFYYVAESYGILNPWIEISAKTVKDFSQKELEFLLGKEIGSIKLGHTRQRMIINEIIKTIQSKSFIPGSEITLEIWRSIMYRWARCASFTTDSVGFLVSSSLVDSVNAILHTILNNRELTSVLSISEYVRQGDSITRMQDTMYNQTKLDEMVPYGPFRIKNLLKTALEI